MTHADEARRIVEALDGIPWWKMIDDKIDADVVNAVEATLEVQIAAALAAAERVGIEKCEALVRGAREKRDVVQVFDVLADRIRALLPAAVAEPAAKCATCGGMTVLPRSWNTCPSCGGAK